MNEERMFLDIEQAIFLMKLQEDGERVHTIMVGGPMILGADWDVEQVRNAVESGGTLELGGPGAMSLGHGIMLVRKGMPLVGIEHDKEAVAALEVS